MCSPLGGRGHALLEARIQLNPRYTTNRFTPTTFEFRRFFSRYSASAPEDALRSERTIQSSRRLTYTCFGGLHPDHVGPWLQVAPPAARPNGPWRSRRSTTHAFFIRRRSETSSCTSLSRISIVPRWTNLIHEEWIRSLACETPELTNARTARAHARLMNVHARDALITGFEDLIRHSLCPIPMIATSWLRRYAAASMLSSPTT